LPGPSLSWLGWEHEHPNPSFLCTALIKICEW
jgi:hypothetical protein